VAQTDASQLDYAGLQIVDGRVVASRKSLCAKRFAARELEEGGGLLDLRVNRSLNGGAVHDRLDLQRRGWAAASGSARKKY
jgi:hypothetical protein